ncbi:hypothetical protein FQN60_003140 [Etheostoma spectabile]|uniref:Leucine-rich repeat-containing protein 51 n=1 Tax=Etheostoma spectabile TaxID=54343 RepID=A0A5J5CLE5_9PERO|nr:hypothetical protein FQN60_003140 [Etheostoma spectabile]
MCVERANSMTSYVIPKEEEVREESALAEVPRNGLRPLKTNSKGKYQSCSLRLSNNSISDIIGLQYILNHFLAQPSKLGWLDLSFNKITCLDPLFCELSELRVLYLHGNNIWNLSDVDQLKELQYLHTITLHGNPIETNMNYRWRLHYLLVYTECVPYSQYTHSDLLRL